MINNIENITFGVELETTIPATAQVGVGQYHNGTNANTARVGSELKHFPKFGSASWKTEHDGSIRVMEAGHRACEFVSPILKGEAGIAHLIEFVEFLQSIGAKVNASCGMHIHIGAQTAHGPTADLEAYIERLVRLVAFNSKALYAQTGTIARENGVYCRKLGAETKTIVKKMKREKRVIGATALNRYHILNLTNLPRTGTVEFRCFAGTLNTNKVLVHLFSVLVLCLVARSAKTPADWENKTLTGSKALTNLLKVRPVTQIVGSPIMAGRFSKMFGKALEMAAKYDAQQAGLDLQMLTKV